MEEMGAVEFFYWLFVVEGFLVFCIVTLVALKRTA